MVSILDPYSTLFDEGEQLKRIVATKYSSVLLIIIIDYALCCQQLGLSVLDCQ